MGREIQPGKFVVLLDFDNKVEGETRNGLELAGKLNLDRYKAPKQKTPSGGSVVQFDAPTVSVPQFSSGA